MPMLNYFSNREWWKLMQSGQYGVRKGPGPLWERRMQHGPYQGEVTRKHKTISCLYPMSYTSNKSDNYYYHIKGLKPEKQSLLIFWAKMSVINSYQRKRRKGCSWEETPSPTPYPAYPILLALGLFPWHSLWGGSLFPEIHSGLPKELHSIPLLLRALLPSPVTPQLCKSWWCGAASGAVLGDIDDLVGSCPCLLVWILIDLLTAPEAAVWGLFLQSPSLLKYKGSPTSEYSLSLLVTPLLSALGKVLSSQKFHSQCLNILVNTCYCLSFFF